MDEPNGDEIQSSTATFSSGDGAVIHIHNSNVHLGAGGNVKFDNADDNAPGGKKSSKELKKHQTQSKLDDPLKDDIASRNIATLVDGTPGPIHIEKAYIVSGDNATVGDMAPGQAELEQQQIRRVDEPPKDDKDLTWLSEGKIAFYKKRPLSETTRTVFYGRQQFFLQHWREVAVKVIEYEQKNFKELDLLKKLRHSNIVQLFDAGKHQGGLVDHIYIVMELCSETLTTYVNKNSFKFEKAFSFVKQIVDGLEYLHSNNVTHRDLKPDNVLFSPCKKIVKLSDFGLSMEIPVGRSSVTVTKVGAGTDGYRPPETYKDVPQISRSIDIFPFGLVTYFIFTNGKHPYGVDPYEWPVNIRKNQNRDLSQIPKFEKPYKHKREQLIDLLEKTLRHDSDDRPTITKIKESTFITDSKEKVKGTNVLRRMFSYRKKPRLKNTSRISENDVLLGEVVTFENLEQRPQLNSRDNIDSSEFESSSEQSESVQEQAEGSVTPGLREQILKYEGNDEFTRMADNEEAKTREIIIELLEDHNLGCNMIKSWANYKNDDLKPVIRMFLGHTAIEDIEQGLLWLAEGKIVLYKNRCLRKSNKSVFYGGQQFFSEHWREVVIKLMESKEKNRRELSLLFKLHHPNIVQIFDFGELQTEMMSYLFIVMELCDQNLRDYVNENPFNFEVSFSFSKQLAAGLAFLHENQVPHGNLKPDNVLVSFDKKTVKLSDFGLSKEIPSGQSAASVTCTGLRPEGFRSPETYQSNTRVSRSVDIFPYGLVTYFTFTKGKHPYGTDPNEQSYYIVKNQNRDLSLIPKFDKPNGHKRVQLLDLLSRTLQHSPRDRTTAKDIERHTFFTDTN